MKTLARQERTVEWMNEQQTIIVAVCFNRGKGVRCVITAGGKTENTPHETWDDAVIEAEARLGFKLSALSCTFRSESWGDVKLLHGVRQREKSPLIEWYAQATGANYAETASIHGTAAFLEEGIERGRKALALLQEVSPQFSWSREA